MRSQFTVALGVLAIGALILAAQLGAFQTPETRAIPLDTAYATFNQEGLKSLDDTAANEQLGDIVSSIQDRPARMVLCVGSDVASAVTNSGMTFALPNNPTPAVTSTASDTVWLAAYLGTDGSMPAAYKVRAIEMTGKTIRVTFERDESSGRSCDLRAYLVWAPVGRVEAGTYTLELFDASTGSITASRLWHVFVK